MSEDRRFSLVQTVRFGDLDAMGHLNNVQVARYFETARIAYIRSLFPERGSPSASSEFGFVIAELHIAYRSQAFFDDEIRTFVWLGELMRSAARVCFEMQRQGDGRLVADGWGTLVSYDYATGRAHPLPERVRERLEREVPEAVE